VIPWTCEQILDGRLHPDFVPPKQTAGDRAVLDPALFGALSEWADAHPDDAVELDEADVAFVRALYDGSVRYADLHVGILLDGLEQLGVADDTLVVVLSDHGEDLLEHGHVNHRRSLHDENVGVVLALRGPGIEPARIASPVSLMDVLPTVARIAGVRASPGHGVDLADSNAERAVFSESVRGDWSVRTVHGRLSLPAGTPSGARPPDVAPLGAFVTDPDGTALPWNSPLTGTLWTHLSSVRP
jgi:arylsulfatase A-like enzyme